MFEEVKESLKALDEKLDGAEKPVEKTDDEQQRKRQQARQTIEHVLHQINHYLQSINRESNSIQSNIQDSERRIISAMETQKKKSSFPDKARVKTKIVVWTIGISLLFSIGSITENILLFKRMKIMRENNLKYEFIRTQGGISKEQLMQLDSLMHGDNR